MAKPVKEGVKHDRAEHTGKLICLKHIASQRQRYNPGFTLQTI